MVHQTTRCSGQTQAKTHIRTISVPRRACWVLESVCRCGLGGPTPPCQPPHLDRLRMERTPYFPYQLTWKEALWGLKRREERRPDQNTPPADPAASSRHESEPFCQDPRKSPRKPEPFRSQAAPTSLLGQVEKQWHTLCWNISFINLSANLGRSFFFF